jgi:hypothetical protein
VNKRVFPNIAVCLGILFFLAACMGVNTAPNLLPSITVIPISTATITPSLPPTETPTATATATEIPRPVGWENLPQNFTLVPNADGSWGIRLGNEAKSIPGAIFDSAGLHLTLDGGRIIDISDNEFKTKITYDQDVNLLQIFDTENIISAEYDGGVSQPDSPDYVAGQGWVDMQELGNKACSQFENKLCFINQDRGSPAGTVGVGLASTGIFRKVNAIDLQTNSQVGNLVLFQFVTQNANGQVVTAWVVAESNDIQGGLQSTYCEHYQMLYKLPRKRELQAIDQWQKWLPKGSLWYFGFMNTGDFTTTDFWRNNQLAPTDYQKNVSQLLINKGDRSLTYKYPLFPNMLAKGR